MKRKYLDEDLLREFPECSSLSQLMGKLGLAQAGGSYTYIKKHCDRLGLDWTAKRGQGWAKGLRMGSRGREAAHDEVFCMDSKYMGSSVSLKRKALKHGYIKDYCEICGQKPIWNGMPMILLIDHIDGNRRNNQPCNLRSICANCDVQLPTSRGKNAKKKPM